MFAPEPEVALLTRMRLIVSKAWPLADEECSQLARGFIGCNLVMDLVRFFREVIRRSPKPIGGGVAYRDVHTWLDQAPDSSKSDALVSPDALENTNPWQRINHLLAVEAVLRKLNGTSPTAAAGHAQRTFNQVLADTDQLPVDHRVRDEPVRQAFDAWWKAFAGGLTRQLQEDIWPRKEELLALDGQGEHALQQRLTAILSQCPDLAPEPLVKLLSTKNVQMAGCIIEMNKGMPVPFDTDWIAEVRNGVQMARTFERNYRWGDRLSANVSRLLLWLHVHGLDRDLGGPGRLLQNTRVWQLAFGPQTISSQDLAVVLTEWDLVQRALRMRGLPAGWGACRVVEDLFSHPLPINFQAWRDGARDYWS